MINVKTPKEAHKDREALAAQVVQDVLETLEAFGLIRGTSDTVRGRAISEAIQHVEAKLPLSI